MKIPLRFQITEFDCGTVALLNALSYIYEREAIPAELIRKIHAYTLDCYDEAGNIGQGGTSREAINKLTQWVTKYTNTHNFDLKFERLEQNEVTLDKIKLCLAKNGCVLVRSWLGGEHYIIVTKIDRRFVYIFDSYYLDKKYYDKSKNVKIILNKPFTHNRKVTFRRFLSETEKDFALGPIPGREAVLINKIK